jgi:hypothetical protein
MSAIPIAAPGVPLSSILDRVDRQTTDSIGATLGHFSTEEGLHLE